MATSPAVLSPQASYLPEEVEAYVAWADAAVRRLRDELALLSSDRDAILAEARREADRLVGRARRRSAELLDAALTELRAAAGGQHGVTDAGQHGVTDAKDGVLRGPDGVAQGLGGVAHGGVCAPDSPGTGRSAALGAHYDAGAVDRYVVWASTTVAALQRQVAAARARNGGALAGARAEADQVIAEARWQAAAIVGEARRQLQELVAAERTRQRGLEAVSPAEPAGSPGIPPVLPAPAPVAGARLSGPAEPVEPVWARRGRLMRNTGVLIILFVLYQLFGTNVEADRTQRRLMSTFTRSLGPKPAGAAAADSAARPGEVSSTTLAEAPIRPLGDALAIIKIPKIGLEQAVVEGTTVADLRKGPGHYIGTSLPGEPGNSGIAGHRTTYGAPFNRLDELVPGDPIIVQTATGTYRYDVSGHEVVKPSRIDVLAPKGDDRLTLTTCHPKYSAKQRYVVWATLSPASPPVWRTPPPGATDPAGPASAADSEGEERDSPTIVSDGSSSFHFKALPPTVLWALLLFGGWWATKRWRRVWSPAPALVVPVLAFGLWQVFRSLSQFLPSNF